MGFDTIEINLVFSSIMNHFIILFPMSLSFSVSQHSVISKFIDMKKNTAISENAVTVVFVENLSANTNQNSKIICQMSFHKRRYTYFWMFTFTKHFLNIINKFLLVRFSLYKAVNNNCQAQLQLQLQLQLS